MSLSKAGGEVLNSAATTAANVQHAIVGTEDGWLVTQNKHRQEGNCLGSAILASSLQRWPAAASLAGGYRDGGCTTRFARIVLCSLGTAELELLSELSSSHCIIIL